MAVNKDKFANITALVIDKLEGGYWNPKWHGVPSGYQNSGETMFGIDRLRGTDYNDTIPGKKFWAKIDSVKTPSVWKWNYMGGANASELKKLVAEIMQPFYEKYSQTYLSPQAKQIVDTDDRLIFHFIYGVWNGSGWFKKFANDINKAVASGVTNTDKLTQVAIDSRTKEGLKPGTQPNKLIAQGGKKIAGFINQLKNIVSSGITKTEESLRQNPLITTIFTTILTISIWYLIKTIKK
jgi:hypothetical protein